ncbi:MAG: PH domain-containing protein [Candidatus Rokuibacteriota bacterium]
MLSVALAARTGEPRWLVLSAPLALALLLMARFAPIGYRLGSEGVDVERRAGPTIIAYRDIRSVDRVPRPLAGISMMGSNGVFGRFGQFWNVRLGFYRLFITDRGKLVWLGTTKGWVALSPDRPDEFVERLSGKIAR